jgi:uncharacterized membrane protein YphA (DoxX/SURF4 family)
MRLEHVINNQGIGLLRLLVGPVFLSEGVQKKFLFPSTLDAGLFEDKGRHG